MGDSFSKAILPLLTHTIPIPTLAPEKNVCKYDIHGVSGIDLVQSKLLNSDQEAEMESISTGILIARSKSLAVFQVKQLAAPDLTHQLRPPTGPTTTLFKRPVGGSLPKYVTYPYPIHPPVDETQENRLRVGLSFHNHEFLLPQHAATALQQPIKFYHQPCRMPLCWALFRHIHRVTEVLP